MLGMVGWVDGLVGVWDGWSEFLFWKSIVLFPDCIPREFVGLRRDLDGSIAT